MSSKPPSSPRSTRISPRCRFPRSAQPSPRPSKRREETSPQPTRRLLNLFEQLPNCWLQLREFPGRQVPHDCRVYMLIFVPQNVADADDLLPFDFKMP